MEDICKFAVQNNRPAIRYVMEDICKLAIMQNIDSMKYIANDDNSVEREI
jgi:hypothetical protein